MTKLLYFAAGFAAAAVTCYFHEEIEPLDFPRGSVGGSMHTPPRAF